MSDPGPRLTSAKGHIWKGEWPRFRYCVECGTVALPHGKNGVWRFMLTTGGRRRFVRGLPECPPEEPMRRVDPKTLATVRRLFRAAWKRRPR